MARPIRRLLMGRLQRHPGAGLTVALILATTTVFTLCFVRRNLDQVRSGSRRPLSLVATYPPAPAWLLATLQGMGVLKLG